MTSNDATCDERNTLPSRFQIGDAVRVGRLRAVVTAVVFRSGKVRYHVENGSGEFGPLDSTDVAPMLLVCTTIV